MQGRARASSAGEGAAFSLAAPPMTPMPLGGGAEDAASLLATASSAPPIATAIGEGMGGIDYYFQTPSRSSRRAPARASCFFMEGGALPGRGALRAITFAAPPAFSVLAGRGVSPHAPLRSLPAPPLGHRLFDIRTSRAHKNAQGIPKMGKPLPAHRLEQLILDEPQILVRERVEQSFFYPVLGTPRLSRPRCVEACISPQNVRYLWYLIYLE